MFRAERRQAGLRMKHLNSSDWRASTHMKHSSIWKNWSPEHRNERRVERYFAIVSGPGVQSSNRLEVMLALLIPEPSTVFWPLFHRTWSQCDGTWHLRDQLVADLRRHNRQRMGTSFLDADGLKWLRSLTDPIPVFRGCSANRVEGVSWSTDRSIAEGFARG